MIQQLLKKVNRSKKTERSAHSAEYDFNVEPLEGRILLAGDVTASLSGGETLKLKGDGADNSVLIGSNAAGDLVISGTDGTNIVVDGVAATSHVLTLDAPQILAGNVKIIGKGGADSFEIDGLTVGRNTIVKLDGGSLSATDASLGGRVRAKGLSDIGLSSALALDNTQVFGKMVVKTQSDATIELSDVTADSDLKLRARNGETTIDLTSTTIEGVNARFDAPDGGVNVFSTLDTTMADDVKLKARGSNDMDMSLVNSSSLGDISAKLSDGNNSLTIDSSTVVGDFDVKTGDGMDTVKVSNTSVGDVSLKLKDGMSEVRFVSMAAVGSVDVDGGADSDSIYIDGGSAVGDISIDTDDGEGLVDISNGADLSGSLTVDAKDGDDTVQVFGATIGGDLETKLAGGDNVVTIHDSEVTGDFDFETDAGLDVLDIQTSNLRGDFNGDFGAGDDSIILGAFINVDGDVTLDGGDGFDSIAGLTPIVLGVVTDVDFESSIFTLIA